MNIATRHNIQVAVLIVCAVMLSCRAEGRTLPSGFDKYNVILERMPFGSVPEEVKVLPAPQPAVQKPKGESWVKDYRLIAITESSRGVRVGLSNIKRKPILSFFLFEGETDDDVTLVKADYDAEKALLSRGAEQYWISMTGLTEEHRSPAPPPGQREDLTNVQNLIARRAKFGGGRGQREPFAVMSKEEYNRRRAEGTIPPPVAARSVLRSQDPQYLKLTSEEKHQKLRAYNLDLIRSGGNHGVPLPIQLTPEEDAQLVAEGVLAPQSRKHGLKLLIFC